MQVLTLIIFFYVSGFSNSIARDKSVPKPTPLKKCGVDRLPPNVTVQEGLGFIESFPWFGLLINPVDIFVLTNSFTPSTTTVILISKDVVLSTALDIDSYSKEDFRARSRVVLGNSCSGPYIRIRDYAFHPDYTHGTFSTLALLQLDIRNTELNLHPICAPPEHFSNGDEIYALAIVNDCYNSSMVVVFKMEHLESQACRDFYRSVEAVGHRDHVAISLGVRAGSYKLSLYLAKWDRSRHSPRWSMEAGISGPGCQSPSRFLDYGMYLPWVKRIIAGIGQPTISRITPNRLVLRRTIKNIPRYGPCDPEESKIEIYSDKITVVPPPFEDDAELDETETAYFNVTLLKFVDYHCIVLQVWNELGTAVTPTIKIRRWCNGPSRICDQPTTGAIDYLIRIKFGHICSFSVAAYGTEVNNDDAKYVISSVF